VDYEIQLKNNKGFNWYNIGDIWAKGYIFDEVNNLYQNEELINYFDSVETEEDFKEKLRRANGFFNIIYKKNDLLFVAVDNLRSFPIFYSKRNGKIFISDSTNWIMKNVKNMKVHPQYSEEYLVLGYVTEDNTLIENINQIPAGEFLIINLNRTEIKKKKYFELQHNFEIKNVELNLIEQLDAIHIKIFQRLIDSLDGRKVILPLSGGYDSRLIAFMLHKLGYTNVLCFTYGNENDNEVKISKKVASLLNFKWVFIPYTREKWNKWYKSEKRKDYYKYSNPISSIPILQDWPAVGELLEMNIIPEDSIFIPGHSGDFLAGSHIPAWYSARTLINRGDFIESIFNKHFNMWNWDRKSLFLKRHFEENIENILGKITNMSPEEAANLFELWDWKERQSKLICNAVRVYEYWGFEWRMPLWDKELIEFWSTISLEFRENRNLYFKYVHEKQNLDVGTNTFIQKQYDGQLKRYFKKIPQFYWILKKIKKLIEYYKDPLCWFGIVSIGQYSKIVLYGPLDLHINSILIKLFLEKEIMEFKKIME
jgi:asparagine synthase (glutamine-hydrolysing)